MDKRTCEVAGCERPHGARGMCYSHYSSWHRNTKGRNDQTFEKVCVQCGSAWITRRNEAKYCSVQCKGDAYRKVCNLPANHPVVELIKQARAAASAERKTQRALAQRSDYAWRTERQCPRCACWFTPLYAPNAVNCSKRCMRRVHRWRRAARERGARGEFTWSEFMRIARKFNYCCAYCGVRPDRLDPDHVIPLSRGGSNTPSNLLPTCFMCNSSKCAMTLPEWEVWLRERDMPPRATSWQAGDPRYTHLTDAALAQPYRAA